MNGAELFAQLPEHIAQASYFEPEKALFENPLVMWRGLPGTNELSTRYSSIAPRERKSVACRKKAGVAWFALAPEWACAPSAAHTCLEP